jgi:hypothetical protein
MTAASAAIQATTLDWAGAAGGTLMSTSFRTYAADPATIVFEQVSLKEQFRTA